MMLKLLHKNLRQLRMCRHWSAFSVIRGLAFTQALLFIVLCWASPVEADWPNWRGPNGNGSISTGEYPVSWTTDSAAWKYQLPGKGSSTPIVLDERIYVTTPADGQDAVLALSVQGERIWQTALGAESAARHRLGSSCNASPTTDGKGVFVYFRSSRLAALELDGTIRWNKDLAAEFGQEELYWDQGTSPVVTDDHVILTRMHAGASWIAGFDKATGELRWQQKRDYETPPENDNGYTTPVFFQHQGRSAFLVWGADHLTAHAAADGSVLWTCGGFNPEGTGLWPAIASPVLSGNLAVVPVGRDDRQGQGKLHAVRLDGENDVTDSHRAWQRDDLGVFVCSPIEYQGRVYLLRPRGEIVCLAPDTGETIWAESLPRGRANYYASPIIANGVMYAAREDGVVFAARVTGKFEVLSENPMNEQIVASPVADQGRLLLRGEAHLFCIQAARP